MRVRPRSAAVDTSAMRYVTAASMEANWWSEENRFDWAPNSYAIGSGFKLWLWFLSTAHTAADIDRVLNVPAQLDGCRCRSSANALGAISRVHQLSHVLGLLAVSRSGDQRLGDSQDNGWVEQPCWRVEHPNDAKELLGYRGICFGGGQDAVHIEHDIADWSLQCRSGIARLDRRSVAAGGSPYRAACAAANRPGFV